VKKALVTSGHKRLGKAIAHALMHAGYDVAIHYRRDPEAADAVVATAHAHGRRAIALQAELTDSAALPALAAAAAEHLGGLSLLVLAAASYDPTPIDQLDGAQLDRAFADNARAQVELMLAARPHLAASGDGRIVVLGDLAAQIPFTGYLAHSMAKAALHAAVRGLASELAPAITVNAIVPGAVLKPAEMPDPAWRGLLTIVPQGQVIADDATAGSRAIAETVVYLGQCSRFVTGAFHTVDGGRTARW
jgi:NAD(P)-dependent dehydrogenase (short-subunit alcohol dehydrogenase family)